MSTGDIIETFQQRRQLEQALDEMSDARNEIALIEAARTIHRTFPVELTLPALLKRLDTPNGQQRGGLARLALLLPRGLVVPALRSYAGDRAKPPLGRTTAAMILERFLREKVPSGLVGDLQESNDAAFQSLLDAVRQGKRNRHVLLEYVTQMQEYGEETAFLVMQNIDRLPAEDGVGLLRLIAQDGRPQVASAALTRLEALADGGETAALRALYTLLPNLNQKFAVRIERVLRKQRFRGQGYVPPSPTGWRALLGVADPGGHMMVWLARTPDEAGQSGFVAGLLVHLQRGIAYDYFADGVERAFLPSHQEIGQLTTIPGVTGPPIIGLEAPFDIGRWLVERALAVHHAGEALRPLSGEYKLYSDLLWQFSLPRVDATLSRLLEPPALEELAAVTPTRLADMVAALLAHPALAGWVFPVQAIIEAATENEPELSDNAAALVGVLLRMMEAEELTRQLIPALCAGLRLQAVWFHLAGEQELAQNAYLAAAAIPGAPTRENPLLIAMLQRGISS